jgi:hypothetical protein
MHKISFYGFLVFAPAIKGGFFVHKRSFGSNQNQETKTNEIMKKAIKFLKNFWNIFVK